jgi:hypothetical protein
MGKRSTGDHMKYKIKSPVMASDVPEALKLIMSDKRDELLELIVQRCTIDETGKPADLSKITLKEKFELISQAGSEFSDMTEGKS